MGPDGRSGLDLVLHEISDGSHSLALRPCLVQRDGIAAFVGSFSACTTPRPASLFQPKFPRCIVCGSRRISTPQPAAAAGMEKGEAATEADDEDWETRADKDDWQEWESSIDGLNALVVKSDNEEDDWECTGSTEVKHRSSERRADAYSDMSTDNILEAYDFPAHLDGWGVDALLEPLRSSGAATQAVPGGTWLVVFRTGLKATTTLSSWDSHSFRLREYAKASKEAQALRLHDIVRPQRPVTSTATASRLLRGALGGQGRRGR